MDIFKYIIFRLLAFFVPFIAIFWLGGGLYLSLGLAAVIGLMLSYLFLGKYRTAAVSKFSKNVAARDAGAAGADDQDMHAEDAHLDAITDAAGQTGEATPGRG